jgi:hypothetical protein
MLTSQWPPAKFRKLLWGVATIFILMLIAPHFVATTRGAYKVAVATAHQSLQFREALGDPVKEGWFSEGKEELGSLAKSEMLIPVQGRIRSGNLRARAIKDGGRWQLTELTLELTRPDERIDLLSKPPI